MSWTGTPKVSWTTYLVSRALRDRTLARNFGSTNRAEGEAGKCIVPAMFHRLKNTPPGNSVSATDGVS